MNRFFQFLRKVLSKRTWGIEEPLAWLGVGTQ